MSTYTPPEGFTFDPNSGLYYMRTNGVDPQTGATGEFITWFYPETNQYQQQFYPAAPAPPPTTHNPLGATTPGYLQQSQTHQTAQNPHKKKLNNGAIAAIVILIVLALGVGLFIIKPWASNDDTDLSQAFIEETKTPVELSTPNEPPDEDTGDETFAMALEQLAEIPYFGDRNILNMTPEQAIEYAKAIEKAECTRGFENYDTIIPVLIDVSNDGVPLLLIIPYGEELQNAWPVGSFYLLGFNNGSVYEICRWRNFAIVTVDNENLLCAYIDSWDAYHDFGQFSLYRINNGAAELISEMKFDKYYPFIDEDTDEADVEPISYYINDEKVSEDFFEQVVGGFRSNLSKGSHLVRVRGHYGHNHFEENDLIYEYFDYPFSRNQVKQAFINYANALKLSQ